MLIQKCFFRRKNTFYTDSDIDIDAHVRSKNIEGLTVFKQKARTIFVGKLSSMDEEKPLFI